MQILNFEKRWIGKDSCLCIMRKNERNKYRLKVSLEKTTVMKKKKPFKRDRKVFTLFNHYKLLYNKAIKHKMRIIKNTEILEIRDLNERAKYIYGSKDFKEIINIAGKIQKYEKRCILLFIIMFSVFSVLSIALSFIFKNILFMLLIPIYAIVFCFLFYPSINFKQFYKNTMLDICIFATGLINRRDSFSYTSKSKQIDQLRTNKWMMDKRLVSNSFKVNTDRFSSLIEKMVIRDTVDHYSIDNGKIKVSKKKATIFSGYSFSFVKNESTKSKNDNQINVALINKNTFLKDNGISLDGLDDLIEVPLKEGMLGSDWSLFVSQKVDIDKKILTYIQKQALAIFNNIGAFNLYFFNDCIRLLYSIKSNRDGLLTDYFYSSLSNPKLLSFEGFFNNIKALYLFSSIEKMAININRFKMKNKNSWRF